MALLGGVRRLPGGVFRVRLTSRERDLLAALPDQLRPLLSGASDLQTPAGRVTDRLFPSAYDDPLDELEYRELVGSQVSEDRLAAVEDFSRTLKGGTTRRSTWTAELTGEQAEAWLSALNDARLTFAMVLGVTDESVWERGPDRRNPTSVALHYLGWLQDSLLRALSSAPQDDDGPLGAPPR